MKEKGLFIAFEGIDGSGTSTHVHKLEERIEDLSKYRDVIRTHEPWKSLELKKKLEQEREIYSDALATAELFIEDRARHSSKLIKPNLDAGTIVLSSRYKMSTCAYQWVQGVNLHELIQMHENRGILTPDITFYLDVPRKVARSRITRNGRKKELFERDRVFIEKLVEAYNCLVHMSEVDPKIFGKVVRINGNRGIKEVSKDIYSHFLPVYQTHFNK